MCDLLDLICMFQLLRCICDFFGCCKKSDKSYKNNKSYKNDNQSTEKLAYYNMV